MTKNYRLSAGALLYTVLKLHKRHFYGVPNVMPKLSDSKFSSFAQGAEEELMKMGLGILNFDGEFAIDPDFAAVVNRCADCSGVVGVSLRRNGAWEKYTLYHEVGVLLTREENYICSLREEIDLKSALIKMLNFPDDAQAGGLTELLCDTDLLTKRDLEGVIAAGCSDTQAKLILNGFDGNGQYAHIKRVDKNKCTGEYLLLYGPDGILSATAEYSMTQEFLRFTPVTAEATVENIKQLLEQK